jgi:hypothetical protein
MPELTEINLEIRELEFAGSGCGGGPARNRIELVGRVSWFDWV